MDMKMQAFLDKVKDMADKTGKVSRHAAGVARKKANDLATGDPHQPADFRSEH